MAVFFGEAMVDVGGGGGIFCSTAIVVEVVTGVIFVAVLEAALTICVFGFGGDAGVMTVLLCCIQNPMPMSTAIRKELTTNK